MGEQPYIAHDQVIFLDTAKEAYPMRIHYKSLENTVAIGSEI